MAQKSNKKNVLIKLLEFLKEKKEFKILSSLLLRNMQKAVYLPQNLGHYGLASKHYSHFTSPIRRYPDLTLHRLVKDYTERNNPQTISYWQKKLFDIANQSSKKEQDAINCERDVEKMKKAEYMEDHIGERFSGVISGVCEFGLFIELENTVEGLARIEELPGDYYLYNTCRYYHHQ